MAFLIKPTDMIALLQCRSYVDDCLPSTREIVDRFELRGRTLMSVGAGGAHEELAFLESGVRRAFLFDIDEHNTLETLLPRLHKPEVLDAPIVYVLDDFTKVQPDRDDLEPIEFLYFSGFTPDEVRRGAIRDEYTNRWLKKIGLSGSDPNWPPSAQPVHDIILKAIDTYLVDGGIFIIQSYFNGVAPTYNPGYLEQWKATLANHRVTLLEGYCFTSAPAVTLWAGMKVSEPQSAEAQQRVAMFKTRLAQRPLLSRFHGRAQLEDKSISRFFPAE